MKNVENSAVENEVVESWVIGGGVVEKNSLQLH